MHRNWLITGLTLSAIGALGACSSRVPNDIGAIESGFGEASLNSQSAMTAQDQVDAILGGSVDATALDPNANIARPIESYPAPGSTASSNAGGQSQDSGALSNSNDFEAISERYTIESDAERLARLGEQYQVISPTQVPERGGQSMSIVEFALVHLRERGIEHYRRSPFASERRSEIKCASYASADKAQEAFLASGGPEKDRLNLDPDGDGYACGWDPTPYRVAVGR